MTRILMGLVVLLTAGCVGGLQEYKTESAVDKHAEFDAIKTYAWATGWPAGYPDQHEHIVAAVNRELAARHLTERTDGHADVTVDYGVLWRTDADLSKTGKVPDRQLPTFPVMTLVVRVREAATGRELFNVRSDTPVPNYGRTPEATLTEQLAQMFERYPTPKSSNP